MTDRDHFAAAALTGLLAGPSAGPAQTFSEFAAEAYRMADAMLRERTNHDAVPAAIARTDAESDRTDKAAPRPGKGAGSTPVTQHTPGECSSPRGCTSEPAAWLVTGGAPSCDYQYVTLFRESADAAAAEEDGTVAPLYRHPLCQDFSQKNLTLTDAERSAIADAADRYAEITPESAETAATLRGMLERLGGGTPVRDNCPPRNNLETVYPASRPPQKFYGMKGDTRDE